MSGDPRSLDAFWPQFRGVSTVKKWLLAAYPTVSQPFYFTRKTCLGLDGQP